MDASGSDDELRLLIQKTARRIRSNRPEQALSDTALAVLFQLDATPDLTLGALAEREHVTPPSMNRTINGLEQRGLVTRTPSPDDHRKVRIALTDEGREVLAETRRLRSRWFSQRLAELSPDERRILVEVIPVLRRLADS